MELDWCLLRVVIIWSIRVNVRDFLGIPNYTVKEMKFVLVLSYLLVFSLLRTCFSLRGYFDLFFSGL